jgi:hypothetical protein
MATKDNPLKIVMKNVSVHYKEPREPKPLFTVEENSFVTVAEE